MSVVILEKANRHFHRHEDIMSRTIFMKVNYEFVSSVGLLRRITEGYDFINSTMYTSYGPKMIFNQNPLGLVYSD